jgi:hypothetical protein
METEIGVLRRETTPARSVRYENSVTSYCLLHVTIVGNKIFFPELLLRERLVKGPRRRRDDIKGSAPHTYDRLAMYV